MGSHLLSAGTGIGRFFLREPIGSGGQGEIWKAQDPQTDEMVAIKIFRGEGAHDVARAQQEAQEKLHHDNIIPLVEGFSDHDPPFIALKWVEGESLRDRMLRGLMPVDECGRILQDIMDALDHAHSNGIVHGDLKPENVIIASYGQVKLTDFGAGNQIASRWEGIQHTLHTMHGVIGTPSYVAPEVTGGQAPTARADLFALGVIVFEMLTGRLPQGRDKPSDLRQNVSHELDDLFCRCYTRFDNRLRSVKSLRENVWGQGDRPDKNDEEPKLRPIGRDDAKDWHIEVEEPARFPIQYVFGITGLFFALGLLGRWDFAHSKPEANVLVLMGTGVAILFIAFLTLYTRK